MNSQHFDKTHEKSFGNQHIGCYPVIQNKTLQKGLVAYYAFDGSANDVSGNMNNGNAIGGWYGSDRFGLQNRSIVLDGITDHVVIENQIFPCTRLDMCYSSYSIAAWVNPEPVEYSGNQYGRIWSHGSSSCISGYMMRLNVTEDGDIRVHMENSDFDNETCHLWLDSGSGLVQNQWNFVVGVVDRNFGAKLYLNGTLSSYQLIDTSNLNFHNSKPAMIGANNIGNVMEFFNGAIDDVMIYNRVLSESDIFILMNLKPVCDLAGEEGLEI